MGEKMNQQPHSGNTERSADELIDIALKTGNLDSFMEQATGANWTTDQIEQKLTDDTAQEGSPKGHELAIVHQPAETVAKASSPKASGELRRGIAGSLNPTKAYWQATMTGPVSADKMGMLTDRQKQQAARQAKHDAAAHYGYGHQNLTKLSAAKAFEFSQTMNERFRQLVNNLANLAIAAATRTLMGKSRQADRIQSNLVDVVRQVADQKNGKSPHQLSVERKQIALTEWRRDEIAEYIAKGRQYRERANQAKSKVLKEMGLSPRKLEKLFKNAKPGTESYGRLTDYWKRLKTKVDQIDLEKSGADMDSKVGNLTKDKQISGQDGNLKMSQLINDQDVDTNPYFRIDGLHAPKSAAGKRPEAEPTKLKQVKVESHGESVVRDKVKANAKAKAEKAAAKPKATSEKPVAKAVDRGQAKAEKTVDNHNKEKVPELEIIKRRINGMVQRSNNILGGIYNDLKPLYYDGNQPDKKRSFEDYAKIHSLNPRFFGYDDKTGQPVLTTEALQLWAKWIIKRPDDWHKVYNSYGQWYSDQYGHRTDRLGISDNERSSLFAINNMLTLALNNQMDAQPINYGKDK